jgi:hypothetical protein
MVGGYAGTINVHSTFMEFFIACHHQHVLLNSMWQRRGYKLVSEMNKFKCNIMLVSKCQLKKI